MVVKSLIVFYILYFKWTTGSFFSVTSFDVLRLSWFFFNKIVGLFLQF